MRIITAYNTLKSWLEFDKVAVKELGNFRLSATHDSTTINIAPPFLQIENDFVVNYFLLIEKDEVLASQTYNGVILKLNMTPREHAFRKEIKNLSYKDDEFLVSVRARETMRCPNPPQHKWDHYKNQIEAMTKKFFNTHRYILESWGYETGDIKTYVQTMAMNFMSRYERSDLGVVDNRKLMYSYLGQKLNHFRSILAKKSRNVLVEPERRLEIKSDLSFQQRTGNAETLLTNPDNADHDKLVSYLKHEYRFTTDKQKRSNIREWFILHKEDCEECSKKKKPTKRGLKKRGRPRKSTTSPIASA